MSLLNEDLNDSALFCKSLIQKRKASSSINPKNSKQLKLNVLLKTSQNDERKSGFDNIEESKNENTKSNTDGSTYFKMKETSNTCPLCLKSFKSDATYSSHMKQCAKTHKMTTQQLLEALELQKKQINEKRDFSLCKRNKPTIKEINQLQKKIVSSKLGDKEGDSYDLALGLAVSKSLTVGDTEMKELVEKPESKEKEIPLIQVLGKKKNEAKKSFLKERTAEDRQRFIIDKVALVLLDEEKEFQPQGKKFNSDSPSINDQLNNMINKSQQLWNCGQNGDRHDWYVEGIKNFMLENEIKTEEKNTESSLVENFESELSKLNLPRELIHQNWKKIINNCKFSDLIGKTKDSQSFYLHSIVMYARFPEILEKNYESIFEKYNLSTILIFLEYLYCGTLNDLVKEEFKELWNLAIDFDYKELVEILKCFKSDSSKDCHSKINLPLSPHQENELVTENVNKIGGFFEKDLFEDNSAENLTQKSLKFTSDEDNSDMENEYNAEKSYWSFLQQEKKRKTEELASQGERNSEIVEIRTTNVGEGFETTNGTDQEEKDLGLRMNVESEAIRRQSDDSATRDLDDEFKINNRRSSSDCIVLSSGSESLGSHKNLENLRFEHSRTPSPIDIEYEVPYYDPYDNFQCFTEGQVSPVGLHSQSLITGDVSLESLKVSEEVQKSPKQLHDMEVDEGEKNLVYCSTPTMKSLNKSSSQRQKRRSGNLTASRIIRKSLGLKAKSNKSSTFQRKSTKRKETSNEKDLADVLTDSILNELSKSTTIQSSTPVRVKNFVEITPISTREELVESVTPSPNFSNMEESLLKEHLSKYGLKKNLGKNKARKILRHIYEELHPLYNVKTGKIVKMLPTDTPKAKKKPKTKTAGKNVKPKQNKNQKVNKDKKKNLNSSKESGTLSDESSGTLEGSSDDNSDGSEFENLSETLTQTVPSNPVDLPSAFFEFLENNSEYHHKILLYEPIWLEALQQKLKESFKKHFKMADLMEFLDQKCITFRSATQVRNAQKKNEKRKGLLKKRNVS